MVFITNNSWGTKGTGTGYGRGLRRLYPRLGISVQWPTVTQQQFCHIRLFLNEAGMGIFYGALLYMLVINRSEVISIFTGERRKDLQQQGRDKGTRSVSARLIQSWPKIRFVISPLRQQAESRNLGHTFLANSLVYRCSWGYPGMAVKVVSSVWVVGVVVACGPDLRIVSETEL